MHLSEEHKKYLAEYGREHYKFFTIRLKLGEDEDLIKLLQDSPNKTEVVKKALRALLKQ